jgi:hypothetical protein
MRPSVTDLCWHIVKEGKYQDAEEFLRLYLDALDEELVELHTYINTRKILNVKELEEEAQSAEGQTEVGERDHTVRL